MVYQSPVYQSPIFTIFLSKGHQVDSIPAIRKNFMIPSIYEILLKSIAIYYFSIHISSLPLSCSFAIRKIQGLALTRGIGHRLGHTVTRHGVVAPILAADVFCLQVLRGDVLGYVSKFRMVYSSL